MIPQRNPSSEGSRPIPVVIKEIPLEGFPKRSKWRRIEALGGRLDIDGPTGQGTRLIAEIPCG